MGLDAMSNTQTPIPYNLVDTRGCIGLQVEARPMKSYESKQMYKHASAKYITQYLALDSCNAYKWDMCRPTHLHMSICHTTLKSELQC